MRIRTAILTGVTGLMLNLGLGSAAFAQTGYRYDDRYDDRQRYDDRYDNRDRSGSRRGREWQAEQIVRQAYRDILRREPDRSGLRQYTKRCCTTAGRSPTSGARSSAATSTRRSSAGDAGVVPIADRSRAGSSTIRFTATPPDWARNSSPILD